MEEVNKNCGIYKITSPTGKIYIGQAVDIKKRWVRYKNPNQTKKQVRLNRSFLKYGVENHQFDIIEYTHRENLNCSERFWQDEFSVIGENGLNCSLTNCGEKRYEHSEETIEKIRQSKSGEKHHMWGKKQSKESLAKRKATMERIGYPSTGKKPSEETIQKIKDNLPVRKGGNNSSAIKVIDTETGMIFNFIGEAADYFNIKRGTLYTWLKHLHRNKTTLKYLENV